jgi:hypothetical protein
VTVAVTVVLGWVVHVLTVKPGNDVNPLPPLESDTLWTTPADETVAVPDAPVPPPVKVRLCVPAVQPFEPLLAAIEPLPDKVKLPLLPFVENVILLVVVFHTVTVLLETVAVAFVLAVVPLP